MNYIGNKLFKDVSIQQKFAAFVEENRRTYTGKKWVYFVDRHLYREFERINRLCHSGNIPYHGNKIFKDNKLQSEWISYAILENYSYTGKDVFDYIDLHCYVEFERKLTKTQSTSFIQNFNDLTIDTTRISPTNTTDNNVGMVPSSDGTGNFTFKQLLSERHETKTPPVDIPLSAQRDEYQVFGTRPACFRAATPTAFNPQYDYNELERYCLTSNQISRLNGIPSKTKINPLSHKNENYYKNLHFQMNMEGASMPELSGKMAGIELNLNQTEIQILESTATTQLMTINENWNITDMAARPFKLPTVYWTTSQNHLDQITTIDSRVAVTYNTQLGSMIGAFKYFRYKSMHVNFLMKTTAFCKGICSLTLIRETQDLNKAYTAQRNFFQAMNGEEPDAILPWTSEYNWQPKAEISGDNLYNSHIFFELQVWNRLFLPAGKGTQVSLVPLVHFEGFEVMFPIYPEPAPTTLALQNDTSNVFYYPSTKRFIEPQQGAVMGNVHGQLSDPSYISAETSIWDFIRHPYIVEILSIPTSAEGFGFAWDWYQCKDDSWSPLMLMSKLVAYAAGGFKYKLICAKDRFTTASFAVVLDPYGPVTPSIDTWQNFPYLIWNLEDSHEFEFAVGNYGPRTLWHFGSNISQNPINSIPYGFPNRIRLFQITTFMQSEGSSPTIDITITGQPFEGDANGNGRFQMFMMKGIQGPPRPTEVRHQAGTSCKILGRLNPPVIDNSCELEEVLEMSDLTTRAWPISLTTEFPTDVPRFEISPSGLNSTPSFPLNMSRIFATSYAGWKGGYVLSLKSDKSTEVWRIIPKGPLPGSDPGMIDMTHNYGAIPPSIFITGATYAVLTVPAFCDLNYFTTLSGGSNHTAAYWLTCNSFDPEQPVAVTHVKGYAQTTRDFRYYFWLGISERAIVQITEAWTNMVTTPIPSLDNMELTRSELNLFKRKPEDKEVVFQGKGPFETTSGRFTRPPSYNFHMVDPLYAPLENLHLGERMRAAFNNFIPPPSGDPSDEFTKLSPMGKLNALASQTFATLRKVGSTAEVIEETSEIYKTIPTKIDDGFNKMSETFTQKCDALQDKLLQTVGNPLETLKETLMTAGGGLGNALYLITLELIDLAMSEKTTAKIAIFALKISNYLGLTIGAIYNIITQASGIFSTQENKRDLHHQGFDIGGKATLSIITLAVAFTGMRITGATDVDPKRMKTTWDMLSVRGRDIMNIKGGITAFMEGFRELKELVRSIAHELFGVDFVDNESELELETLRNNLAVMGTIGEKFSQPGIFAKLADSPKLIAEVEKIHQVHGETINLLTRMKDPPRQIITAFNLISRELKKLFDAISENAVTPPTKLVPFHIRIVGQPGVGKSMLIKHFTTLLCNSQGIAPTVYYNAAGVEFKDGLQPGTNVLVRDDGDMVESFEYGLELINLVSPIPMVQNMADLTKKGRYANYKFIISTGNKTHPEISGISSGKAWLRRTHMLIRAKRNAQQLGFESYEFALLPPTDVNDPPIEKSLTFDQLCTKMIYESSKHLCNEMQLNNITSDIDFTPTQWLETEDNAIRAAALVEHVKQQHYHGQATFKPKDPNTLVFQGKVEPRIGPFTKSEAYRKIFDQIPEEEVLGNAITVMLVAPKTESEQFSLMYKVHNEYYDTPIDIQDLLRLLGEELRSEELKFDFKPEDNVVTYVARIIKQCFLKTPAFVLDMFVPCPYWTTFEEICEQIEEYNNREGEPTRYESVRDYFKKQLIKSRLRREMYCRLLDTQRAEYEQFYYAQRSHMPLFLVSMRNAFDMRPSFDFVMAILSPITFGYTSSFGLVLLNYTEFLYNKIASVLEKAKANYKILTLAITGIFMYSMFISPMLANTEIEVAHEGMQLKIQGQDHIDLPDDNQRHLHLHICEERTCGKIFSHTHRKQPLIDKGYSMKCPACRLKQYQRLSREKTGIYEIDDEEAELIVFENHSYDNSTLKGRAYKQIKFEAFSYDHTTIKGRPPRYIQVEKDQKLKTAIKQTKLEGSDEFGEPSKTIPTFAGLKLQGTTLESGKKFESWPYLDDAINFQGTTDENCGNIRRKIARNMGVISYFDKNKVMKMKLNFTGLREKKMMTNFHLIAKDWIAGHRSFDFGIRYQGTYKLVTLYRKDITPPSTFFSQTKNCEIYTDMMIVDLTKANMNAFANITHLFAEERDFPMNLHDSGGFLVVINDAEMGATGMKIHMVDSYYTSTVLKVDTKVPMNQPKEATVGVLWALEYKIPTELGWCGSMLVLHNPLVKNKIVGMHCSGGDNFGCSVPVYQEQILAALGPIETTSMTDIDNVVLQCRTDVIHDYIPLTGTSKYVGVLSSPVRMNRKSDLRTSPIYDELFQHKTEPAALSKYDPRLLEPNDPLLNGLNKFSREVPIPTWDIRNKSIQTVTKMMLEPHKNDSKRETQVYRILTTEEAINGDGMQVEPLNMKSSAGFPFTKVAGKGKYKMVKNVGTYPDGRIKYEPTTELQYYITTIEQELFTTGVPHFNFYQDQMKDERRKIPRVQSGETRLFNIGNMAWLIIKKKYYWWLYEYAKTHMTDIRLGIGFNMHGSDPTRLIQHLKRVGALNGSDGDVKEWDGRYGPDVWEDTTKIAVRLATVIIIRVTSEELSKMNLVGLSARYRIHICEDMVYIVFWGMPSGDFLTALFNSIGHLQKDCTIWNIFWLQETINGREGYHSDDWITLTYCCKMGDDDINSVHDTIRDIYTPTARQQIWIALGYEYTDATKTGEMRYKDIMELSFLKCNFKTTEYPNFYKMGIDEEYVIQELTNWVRIGQDPSDALYSNLEDSLRFASGYGEEKFEHYKDMFNTILSKKQYQPLTINYDEIELEWLKANKLI